MKMRERDEKKRSILWRIVTLGSTLVIILVLGFFIMDFTFGNPVEGEWVAEEKGYYLDIDDDNELTIEGTFDGKIAEIELNYFIDKKAKTITIQSVSDIEGLWTTEEMKEANSTSSVTFEYSLGRKTLTLTGREYGEEFVFTRK